MKRIFSRTVDLDQFVEGASLRLKEFLQKAPLEDSSLIFDGPGLGCANQTFILALLGPERLAKLKEIHFVSASAYAILFYLAKQGGHLTRTREGILSLNRDNQNRHRIRFPQTLFISLYRFLTKQYLFRGNFGELALTTSVTPEFALQPFSALPANIFFWAYNENQKKIVAIHRDSELGQLSLGPAIQATVSVPRIWEPLIYKGERYSDAIFSPTLREHFRGLRMRSKNVFFSHMSVNGQKDNTLFHKAHFGGSGNMRAVVDFLYFVLGLDNREFNEGAQKALFDTKPI